MRRASAMVGVLAIAAMAACTTISGGTPVPGTTVETTSSGSAPSSTSNDQELPFAGAPKVDDPLDTTRFQQAPCLALTPEQAEDLTFPPEGTQRNMPLGLGCKWSNPGNTGSVTIHFSDRSGSGLSGFYQANEDGRYAFFNVLPPIGGYPAIAADVVDDRDGGSCNVVVGVSDEITFEALITLSLENIGKKDPCEIAVMVAGMALETMKNG